MEGEPTPFVDLDIEGKDCICCDKIEWAQIMKGEHVNNHDKDGLYIHDTDD